MQELVKIGFLGITGVLLAAQFKGHKPEYAVYIGFGISIVIFAFALGQVEAILSQMDKVMGYLEGTEGYLAVLVKVLGIAYICEFSAGICKDAGYQSVAGQIEVLGKLAVMFAGLPVLMAVVEMIHGFL